MLCLHPPKQLQDMLTNPSAATRRRCLVEGWLKTATSGLQRTHRIVFALKLPCSCISLYSVSSVIAVWVELDILHSVKKNLLKIENMCFCSSLFLFLWSYWQVLAFLMRLRTFYHCRALFLRLKYSSFTLLMCFVMRLCESF